MSWPKLVQVDIDATDATGVPFSFQGDRARLIFADGSTGAIVSRFEQGKLIGYTIAFSAQSQADADAKLRELRIRD